MHVEEALKKNGDDIRIPKKKRKNQHIPTESRKVIAGVTKKNVEKNRRYKRVLNPPHQSNSSFQSGRIEQQELARYL